VPGRARLREAEEHADGVTGTRLELGDQRPCDLGGQLTEQLRLIVDGKRDEHTARLAARQVRHDVLAFRRRELVVHIGRLARPEQSERERPVGPLELAHHRDGLVEIGPGERELRGVEVVARECGPDVDGRGHVVHPLKMCGPAGGDGPRGAHDDDGQTIVGHLPDGAVEVARAPSAPADADTGCWDAGDVVSDVPGQELPSLTRHLLVTASVPPSARVAHPRRRPPRGEAWSRRRSRGHAVGRS
jgi:hypothetical protein